MPTHAGANPKEDKRGRLQLFVIMNISTYIYIYIYIERER